MALYETTPASLNKNLNHTTTNNFTLHHSLKSLSSFESAKRKQKNSLSIKRRSSEVEARDGARSFY